MQNLFKTLLLTAVVGLIATACTTANAPSGASGESATSSSPTATTMSDTELEDKIKAQYTTDTELKSADLSVDADADKNEVTLSGVVASQALRNKAVEMARSVQAALIVNDKIEVRPREVSRVDYTEEMADAERERAKSYSESIGDSLDDAWIHAKIVAKLIDSYETPERKINVDVSDNVVILRGTVDNNNQKMVAERIAKETEGVKRVTNQLKVGPVTTPVSN